MMRFVHPFYLYYGMALSIAVLLILLWSERRYKRLTSAFARLRPLKLIAPFYPFRRPALRISLLVVSIMFISAALARPQWGFYLTSGKGSGVDIIIAVDLSRSMGTRDISPDRITCAKDEISNYVSSSKGDRLALIGFSGDAFLFTPLTMNRDLFSRVLDNMKIGSVKRGGTSYYNLVTEAARSFKGAATKNKALVIFSDGGDTEDSVEKAISEAKKYGVVIYTIGIGTRGGGLIPINDKDVKGDYAKDDKGLPVRSRMEESALMKLASETGGVYEHAGRGLNTLEKIRTGLGSKIGETEKEEIFSRVYKERFQIPLFLAFIALGLELFLSMLNKSDRYE